MKDSYDGSCESTLPTIMKCGRIKLWKRMRRWLEKSSRQQRARSFLCRRLADCIIAICGQRKSNWAHRSGLELPVQYSPGLGGAVTCFDDLGCEIDGHANSSGQATVSRSKTKPSHGQIEFLGWTTRGTYCNPFNNLRKNFLAAFLFLRLWTKISKTSAS